MGRPHPPAERSHVTASPKKRGGHTRALARECVCVCVSVCVCTWRGEGGGFGSSWIRLGATRRLRLAVQLMASTAERVAALARERAELRAAARRERSSLRAEERFWVLPDTVRHTSLALFDLVHADAEPVMVYLSGVARQYKWAEKSTDELRRFVEDLFLDATSSEDRLESLVGLTDVANPTDAVAMQTAIRRALEWQVVAWAREKNERIGLAPSSDSLLQRQEHGRVALPETARPCSVGQAMKAGVGSIARASDGGTVAELASSRCGRQPRSPRC